MEPASNTKIATSNPAEPKVTAHNVRQPQLSLRIGLVMAASVLISGRHFFSNSSMLLIGPAAPARKRLFCVSTNPSIYLSFYVSTCLIKYLSHHLLVYLSTHLIVYQPIYLSAYLPICISAYLPFYLRIYLPIYLSTYLPIYPSVSLSIRLPIHPSIHLSVSISISLSMSTYLSVYLSICLSIYLAVYASMHLCIYLSFFLSLCPSLRFQFMHHTSIQAILTIVITTGIIIATIAIISIMTPLSHKP